MSESENKEQDVNVAVVGDKCDNAKSDNIPSETSSVASESSGVIRKPSGLKQPSVGSVKSGLPTKIGRLCSGQQKPAVPSVPPKCKSVFLYFYCFVCLLFNPLLFGTFLFKCKTGCRGLIVQGLKVQQKELVNKNTE